MELILNTFGTALRVENGIFLVIHPDGKQPIHPGKLKSILISKGASISSDAALLAIENEIDVMFVDGTGKPSGRVWGIKYGSVSTIRRKQLEFLYSPKSLSWVKGLITQKIDNQIGLLLALSPMEEDKQQKVNKGINRLNDYKQKIRQADALYLHEIAPSLRGWEGAASKAYFSILSGFLPTAYQFENRSQNPATDVFNCLLNYAYGILYGKVEGALIKAGIDPYAGIFHRDDYNRPALVYDVIELYRIWADYVVFNLCMQQVIDPDCYSVREDGAYWLENMGKRILIQSMNDYLDEVVNIRGLERTRATHIELQAHQTAKLFLNS
ncbi:MAG: CRISPR-associated endonuclease Cas1 [Bacteroidales bacterium]